MCVCVCLRVCVCNVRLYVCNVCVCVSVVVRVCLRVLGGKGGHMACTTTIFAMQFALQYFLPFSLTATQYSLPIPHMPASRTSCSPSLIWDEGLSHAYVVARHEVYKTAFLLWVSAMLTLYSGIIQYTCTPSFGLGHAHILVRHEVQTSIKSNCKNNCVLILLGPSCLRTWD
jgi:hypothetical protein